MEAYRRVVMPQTQPTQAQETQRSPRCRCSEATALLGAGRTSIRWRGTYLLRIAALLTLATTVFISASVWVVNSYGEESLPAAYREYAADGRINKNDVTPESEKFGDDTYSDYGDIDSNCPEGPACRLPKRYAISDLSISKRMISTTNLNFICVTMDWWPEDKCDYGHCPWHNASMLNVNLYHPLLRNAVETLSPVVLRLGGSLTDHIVYKVPSAAGKPPPPCHPITKDTQDPLGFRGGCLTMQRWDELNRFCADLGCSVVFDLNLAGGLKTMKSDPWWRGGEWDHTNVKAFLEYTRAQKYPILGFELGNEVDIFHGVGARVPTRTMARAFMKLHNMVADLWPEKEHRPLIIGPESSVFDMQWYLEFVVEMGKHLNVIDVFTYHIYSLGPGSPLLNPNMTDHMLNATKLSSLHVTTDNAQLFVETLHHGGQNKHFQLWCGEGGGAFNSGRNLYTNSFISGFWFLDQLGTMAQQSHQAYCRQTLIGGYYGMINITTMHVNPDYYTALLWRRLMGRKVLGTNVFNTRYIKNAKDEEAPEYVEDTIRVYAHCTHRWFIENHTQEKRGSVTMAFINLSTHVSHTINITDMEVGPRAEYIIRSPRRGDQHLGLYSHHIQLNGKTLRVLENKIPELPPNWIFDRSKPLVIPPLSYGYLVFPEAKNPVCMTPPIPNDMSSAYVDNAHLMLK